MYEVFAHGIQTALTLSFIELTSYLFFSKYQTRFRCFNTAMCECYVLDYVGLRRTTRPTTASRISRAHVSRVLQKKPIAHALTRTKECLSPNSLIIKSVKSTNLIHRVKRMTLGRVGLKLFPFSRKIHHCNL